ncbi:unannotated protein [freshwater metagenome]|uniref:Unannotated protein n=1 Tax=freshwater metagenome TaxID=449393 RepID=A0A6J6KJW7_9ZZZZ
MVQHRSGSASASSASIASRNSSASWARRFRATIPNGIDHARSQPGAIHRYPRWRSRCLSSMASKPAVPRTSFGKSTWHTCTYLLQVRRCFTSWFTQAKHCSSAGLLQRTRRNQEACDRNWRRSVGNRSCICLRALRHGM